MNSQKCQPKIDWKTLYPYQPSILKVKTEFNYCYLCADISSTMCSECEVDTIGVKIYWHNVPLLNGSKEKEEDCVACQLSNMPSKGFHEVSLCERDLGSYIAKMEPNYKEVEFYMSMSCDVLKVEC